MWSVFRTEKKETYVKVKRLCEDEADLHNRHVFIFLPSYSNQLFPGEERVKDPT